MTRPRTASETRAGLASSGLHTSHAAEAYDRVDEIPAVLHSRVISLLAFDSGGMIFDAALSPGNELRGPIEELLQRPETAYLHLHYAKFGCYACRVDRA